VLLELGDDLVGLAQELGEGPFDYSQFRDISELPQKSTS
jgi:hypothetical protein